MSLLPSPASLVMFTHRFLLQLRACTRIYSIKSANPTKPSLQTMYYGTLASLHRSYRAHATLALGVGTFVFGIAQYVIQQVSTSIDTSMDKRLETLSKHVDHKFTILDGQFTSLAHQMDGAFGQIGPI